MSEFSEKFFFLKAFHGLTLTLVLSRESDLTPNTLNALVGVLQDLLAHRVKVLILFQQIVPVAAFLEALGIRLSGTLQHLPSSENEEFPAQLWKRPTPLMALGFAREDIDPFFSWVSRLGVTLRLPRIVLIRHTGGDGWCDADGNSLSFVNHQRLKRLNIDHMTCSDKAGCEPFLRTIRELLTGGVKAVSLCRLEELEMELFSYEGEGLFFSRRHYCQVRRLTMDDFSQAAAVIRRGEKEGFLLPRSDDDLTAILVHGYGAFIAEHHLAGVCSLVTEPYQLDNSGEITALYALTRFHGEGVGGRLITRLVQEAKRQRLSRLFACVRDQRAVDFFLHHGFQRIAHTAVPVEKWHHYDPARKARITCLGRTLRE
ncbi:MAG: GNAT family N-acetyltransferase [Magnetococcales bacterium]|nr:GNAT family N-acetyltransferase [Magnetococcales bacterium]